MDSTSLQHIIKLCMSSVDQERKQGLNYLGQAQKMPNFAPLLLQISSDYSFPREIQQNAAIQLKNYVRFWENKPNTEKNNNEDIYIPEQDKNFLKSNILPLLSTCSDKTSLKIYMQIINKILKNDDNWGEFLESVKIYLKSTNPFEILCGVGSFYQMSKCYEFGIDDKRIIYNKCFEYVCENLENLIEGVIRVISEDNRHFSDDSDHQLTMKIIYKILKIFFTTIQMEMPNMFFGNQRIDKWINYVIFFIKLDFPVNMEQLNKNPTFVSDLENLRKSYLWKIKYVCYDTIYKFYEKFSDAYKIGKKDQNLKDFNFYIQHAYSKIFYDTFLYALHSSKDNYVEEEIICLVYEFLQLILNRRDPILMPFLENDIRLIVNEYLISSVQLSVSDFDMMKNNVKQYIYKQYEKNLSFESRRFAVCQFTEKLCEYIKPSKEKRVRGKSRKNKPEYLDYVYDFLINTITSLNSEIKKINIHQDFLNLNYLNLIKESCFKLLESISYSLIEHHYEKIENLISTLIVPDIDINSHYTLPFLRERAFAFIVKISDNLNIKNFELTKFMVEQVGIYLSVSEVELFVTVKCALLIPKLLRLNDMIREIFKSEIIKIFSIFIKLIQELDLDQLLSCLQDLVSQFPKEVVEFSLDLTNEMVNSFNRFIIDENGGNFQTNNEGVINNEDFDESVEETSSVVTACGVIQTMNKLLEVCSKEKIELFYQIESKILPIIFWTLSSDQNLIFDKVLEVIFTITTVKCPLTQNAWHIFSALLDSLLILDNNTGSITEGIGIENFHVILPIILNFILKEPENFLVIRDSKGIQIINKTMDYIHILINHFIRIKEDHSCAMVTKILIVLLETYKEKLDHLLKGIVVFLIDQMKSTNSGMYKMMLVQTLSLCYVYNPHMTNAIIEEMNITHQIFEMWVGMINLMRFDFEFRRTSLAFSSLLLIDESLLNVILKNNMTFILSKIIDLLKKCLEMKERKKGKDEVEVEGDNLSDSEDERDFDFKSKTKNFKTQLKDFIEDDLNIMDDEDDEDYNELENSFEKNNDFFKTPLDSKDEILYFRDILNFISQNKPEYYNRLMNMISDSQKSELAILIDKAQDKANKIPQNEQIEINEEKKEIENIRDMFEIKRTNFLGCSKWEDIFLDYDYKNLKFYSDRIYKKLILEIKNDQILNSVKRQMCPEHKNTFSIFYYDNSKNIKELRLRCMRRFDDDKYVNLLRKNTKFDKYVFKYKNSRIDIHDYIKGFKPEYSRNPFDFYAAFEGLNLIMKFKKVNTFFQNLQIKCGYIDDIQEESINQDNRSNNMTEENKSKSIISWGEVELSIKNNENHTNLLIDQKEESDKLKN